MAMPRNVILQPVQRPTPHLQRPTPHTQRPVCNLQQSSGYDSKPVLQQIPQQQNIVSYIL